MISATPPVLCTCEPLGSCVLCDDDGNLASGEDREEMASGDLLDFIENVEDRGDDDDAFFVEQLWPGEGLSFAAIAKRARAHFTHAKRPTPHYEWWMRGVRAFIAAEDQESP